MTRYINVASCPPCLLSMSLSGVLQEYRKLPALKAVHFLKLGRLPGSPERLWNEHALSLGEQGLRKERQE